MASRNQGSAPRALVVEDIKVDCLILMHMLHKLNCEAIAVENGKEAVDLFLEGKTFDIVFSDKDMPIMSGPEVYIFQLDNISSFIFISCYFFLNIIHKFLQKL